MTFTLTVPEVRVCLIAGKKICSEATCKTMKKDGDGLVCIQLIAKTAQCSMTTYVQCIYV